LPTFVSCLLGDRDAKLAASVRQSRAGNRRIRGGVRRAEPDLALSHQIQADFNLDNTSIGLLIALPTLLGALMRVPMERAIAGIDSGLRWPDRCA
jgi:hypothetical protein